jgi:peptide/nickel transport system substrate-binding protein
MRNFRASAQVVAAAAALGLALATAPAVLADGTLRYATVGEPPSLDQHVVTSDLATTIAHHMFEGLYTFDGNYEPQPLLASGETVSADGTTITIQLREGVRFHDGQPMTSADVVASLKRWGEHGSRGKLLFSNVAEVSASGAHSVKLTFKTPFGPWKNLLAFINGGPAIYPAAVASAAGKAPIDIKDYIGTGPYMFGEWKPNRHVELVRFDGYNGPAGDASGYAGARAAHFDRLRFIPVPDPGTRINGLRAGDYDYAESVPSDLFDELDNDPAVDVVLNGGPIFGLVFMNSKAGPLQSNVKLRQAIQAALNKEDALRVSIGPEKLWRANGSFLPMGNAWYSDSGTDHFSEGNAEKAGALASEAGYDGTPIKFLVSTNYAFHYDQAVVFTRQLLNAGINVEMVVVDWATLIKKRAQPDQWDLFFTHHGFVPDPILISVMNDNYPGWWTTAEKQELKDAFTVTNDPDDRKATWDRIQELIYTQVPTMKTGDVYTYNIASPQLDGIEATTLIWPHFWGVSK